MVDDAQSLPVVDDARLLLVVGASNDAQSLPVVGTSESDDARPLPVVDASNDAPSLVLLHIFRLLHSEFFA